MKIEMKEGFANSASTAGALATFRSRPIVKFIRRNPTGSRNHSKGPCQVELLRSLRDQHIFTTLPQRNWEPPLE